MIDTDQRNRLAVALVDAAATRLGIIFREQPTSDFGIDAQFELKTDGEATGRLIAAQIKGGPSYFKYESNDGFWLPVSSRHKNMWLSHSLPVVIILCDTDDSFIYWELVTEEGCISTGKEWKILIPKSKTLTVEWLNHIKSIFSPIAALSDYTIIKSEDCSYALARRASVDIAVHTHKKTLNKPTLGSIIRSALRSYQKSQNAPSATPASIGANRPLDVLWGFVYLREVDQADAAWVCRFQWISSSLEDEYKPIVLSGENAGDGLVIDWHDNSQIGEILEPMRKTKPEFLAQADRSISSLRSIIIILNAVINEGPSGAETANFLRVADQYESAQTVDGGPPHECQRLSQALSEIRAIVGNTALILRETNTGKRNNQQTLFLCRKYHNDLEILSSDVNFLRREAR